jgi:Icc-related predicted phosphoesterase
MNVIAITDIHGRTDYGYGINERIRNADTVILAGDLTHFGGKQEARLILHNMRSLNDSIQAIPGNCDRPAVNELLDNLGINLHGKIKRIDGINCFGLGGSNKSPFNTPQEYEESRLAETLALYEGMTNDHLHIFVSHAPPINTNVDRTIFGKHVGSTAVRDFIEKHQPDIVLCGHIHEARGTDRIGTSLIINPGPFPAHFALVQISKDIGYELF